MKKYVEVDREPRVGDMVKVIRPTVVPNTNGIADYKFGDVLKIFAKFEGDYRYSDDYFADNGRQRVLHRKEFVVVEQVNEFTKSDIKGGYLVKLRDYELGLVVMTEDNHFNLVNRYMYRIECGDNYYNEQLLYANNYKDYFDIIEVYGYTTDQSNLFDTSTRELLFKREDVEDLGKKEYVIESIDDENITISPNSSKGYDDSDDSIYIVIGDEPSNAFTTLSIQSAKDMISALQEIVDYVEGGK